MKRLQMPSSYASLSKEEQLTAFGGGELGDAVGSFFDNLHINDFFFESGLISFSFTFVPMLLFRVVKLGVQTGISIYRQLSRLFGLTRDTATSTIQYLDTAQQRLAQTNSAPTLQTFSLRK